MHDPKTVAFEIKYPWKAKPSEMFPQGYRHPFVTVWHVDPEKNGDSDSCWARKLPTWRGWRFHFWHWKIQVHPLQNLKRWLFSRCAGCGKRFPWGYFPVTREFGGDGPRWFFGEIGKYHHWCMPVTDTPDEFTSAGAPERF